MGTRVWLHGLVGDQEDLNGQRATVLQGQADEGDTRYFLETDEGRRVQARHGNLRRTAQYSEGSGDEGGATQPSIHYQAETRPWHTPQTWQADSFASLDTDFPVDTRPHLPERPRPVTWAPSSATSSMPSADHAARTVSLSRDRAILASVKRGPQSPPAHNAFMRVGDLLSDSLRRLPLTYNASREPEPTRRSPERKSTLGEVLPSNFPVTPGTSNMLLETVGITWQHIQLLNDEMGKLGDARVLDVNTEVISSTIGFASRSTCGIMLAGNRIDNLVIGGPAFNSGKLSKNDEILRVDGAVCSTHEHLADLILGDDEPNTPVTLTIRRHGYGSIDHVTLIRMANEEIADKRALFELFTQLKDSAERLGGTDCGRLCDRVILLWSKMVLADAVHDESIEENVKSLQAALRTLAEEQRFHMEQIHKLNLKLAQKLSVAESVMVELVLDWDMSEIVDEEEFGQVLSRDVASAVSGVEDKLQVTGLSKGSNVILVGLGLGPGVGGENRSSITVARELQIQAGIDDSPLRRGIVTQKLKSLVITEIPEHAARTAQLEMQVEDGERREAQAEEEIAALKQLLGW